MEARFYCAVYLKLNVYIVKAIYDDKFELKFFTSKLKKENLFFLFGSYLLRLCQGPCLQLPLNTNDHY